TTAVYIVLFIEALIYHETFWLVVLFLSMMLILFFICQWRLNKKLNHISKLELERRHLEYVIKRHDD
ncbi:MAG: hypothetical protein WAV11_03790, partial [Minisyncoccia bacterium]